MQAIERCAPNVAGHFGVPHGFIAGRIRSPALRLWLLVVTEAELGRLRSRIYMYMLYRHRGARPMTAIAEIFKSGNGRVVRLPDAFRFDASEVEVFRHGAEVALRDKPFSLSDLLNGATSRW